jgi:hypothetical protein
VPFIVTVNAVDANWNVVNATDTVRITSTDTNAVLPANAALVGGTQTFTVILNTGGSRTVTATDMTDGAKTANTSPATTVNLIWKGLSFTVLGTGAGATTNANGTAELTRGSADASLTNALASSLNASGTPWVKWTYVDSGSGSSSNIDIYIEDAVHALKPRLQAGTLFFYEGLGYVRYGAVTPIDHVPFAVGANTRSAGKVHALYVGKRPDGTVDYKFDGMWYNSSLLTTNVGAWDFHRFHLRLRNGASGNKVVFTDFQYGDDHVDLAPTLTAITNPAAILEDAGEQTILLSGISAGGGGSQTLIITATADSPSLITNLAVNYSSPDTTATLSYQPVLNASGTSVITVRLEYDGGETAGGTNAIQRTFTVVVLPTNDAPAVTLATYPRAANMSAKFLVSALLTNASDAEGDTLVFQSVGSGTNGASVTVSGGYIFYQPSATNPNRNTDDHLVYTVNDGQGGEGSNRIWIKLTDPNPGSAGAGISGIQSLGNGHMLVKFHGIPGYVYHIESTATLNGQNTVWTNLGTATELPANSGYFEFEDANPPEGQGYYRTVWP